MGYAIRAEILDLGVYKAGKPIDEVKRELGLEEVIKLASNENPLGCSPKVKEALNDIINETHMYPDASNFELKEAIGKRLGISPEQVFCGTGSDSLIRVICNTFINPGDESIMAEITFPRYEASVKLMGGKVISIPMKNNGLDIEEMVNAITERTKIIWFCNPNNPTGTIFTREELDKVLGKIPPNVVIIMDEAYIEYVTDKNFPDSLELLPKYPNMVILRTFSKAYGLAALRCGYGIVHKELGEYFNRIIGPFDVNLFAQKAAIAALEDEAFLRLVHDTNVKGRDYLYEELDKMRLPYARTNANFIMMNTLVDDKVVFDKLLRAGIIVRPGYLLGMPGWMRVTIGTEVQNHKFIKALKEILATV
ncbi:histidinol-phosphate transaminase [Clostridium sp. UBA4548]|uniref:histidinol-phosphate transaminase n=1 Tax=Clostridium sp. UBA4548 TaxID=1946361 RepID=UPI0025B7A7D3|nr:histidinol-phosphate transaminase [Clostridium sp. UBA4548]